MQNACNKPMRSALMFLDRPDTHISRIAVWLTRALRAQGRVVQLSSPLEAGHRIALSVDGVEVALALHVRNPQGADQADLGQMPEIGDDFHCDLTDIDAALLVEAKGDARTEEETVQRLLAWTAYQVASGLAADFIHWRMPSARFGAEEMLAAALPVAETSLSLAGAAMDIGELRPDPARFEHVATSETSIAAAPAALPDTARPGPTSLDIDRLDARLRDAFGRRPRQAAPRPRARRGILSGLLRAATNPVSATPISLMLAVTLSETPAAGSLLFMASLMG